jgi:membrane protein
LSTATTSDDARTGVAPRSPVRLGFGEWLAVLKRSLKEFIDDDCMGLAQQVAFSSLLAFLPTVVLAIGLLGLFGNGAFDSLRSFIGTVAPSGVMKMIKLAQDDAASNKSGSAIAFVVGLFAAVWAASGAMSAVVKAVNRAYERMETRPFWKVRLTSLVLVIANGIVLAGVFILLIFGGAIGDAIARKAGLGGAFTLIWNIARWPIVFVAILLFFALVYYLAPNKHQRSWKWVTPGSVIGAIMWLVLSALFALYTSFSSSYAKTYGSVAGAIILLLWLNYSAWAVLFGAEVNSELDRQADIHAAGGPNAGLTEPGKRIRPA